MPNPRVFTFGCSYTSYVWPSWADIILRNHYYKGYDVYNFGLGGMGNMGIFLSMQRADTIYKFTEDDLLLVMWTSWPRHDFYDSSKEKFRAQGNVLSWQTEEYLTNNWSFEDDMIKSLSVIHSARNQFNLAWEGHMGRTSVEGIPDGQWLDGEDDLLNKVMNCHFPNYFDMDPSYTQHKEDKIFRDFGGHPGPVEHLKYVQKTMGWEISNETMSWAMDWRHKWIEAAKSDRRANISTKKNRHRSLISNSYLRLAAEWRSENIALWTDLEDYFKNVIQES